MSIPCGAVRGAGEVPPGDIIDSHIWIEAEGPQGVPYP